LTAAYGSVAQPSDFSNFGSLKSTETARSQSAHPAVRCNFSNFGSLKSTETGSHGATSAPSPREPADFSNFGSLKSTETDIDAARLIRPARTKFQQFRLVEEH
jgi:hypothetical protein